MTVRASERARHQRKKKSSGRHACSSLVWRSCCKPTHSILFADRRATARTTEMLSHAASRQKKVWRSCCWSFFYQRLVRMVAVSWISEVIGCYPNFSRCSLLSYKLTASLIDACSKILVTSAILSFYSTCQDALQMILCGEVVFSLAFSNVLHFWTSSMDLRCFWCSLVFRFDFGVHGWIYIPNIIIGVAILLLELLLPTVWMVIVSWFRKSLDAILIFFGAVCFYELTTSLIFAF